MPNYEIRVLSSGPTIGIMDEAHLSDPAAIQSARRFAGDLPIEVWRGLECIYPTFSASGRPDMNPPHPMRGAGEVSKSTLNAGLPMLPTSLKKPAAF